MRKLVEVTHVALGGEIGSPGVWAQPYLDDQHLHYASDLLNAADALLLGRRTYEGLSAAYPKMVEQSPPGAPRGFVDRMNQIPKFVASTTLRQATWNATVIDGDVAAFVADLKRQPGQNLLKYGTGPLDATLMKQGLIDEFPVAHARRRRPGAASLRRRRLGAAPEAHRYHQVRQRRRHPRLRLGIAFTGGRFGTHFAPRAPGCHPALDGGPWLRRTFVLSAFHAVVVPSGFRTSVQPHL